METKSTGSTSNVGAIQWQVREIQAAVIEEYDGIVLVPAGDDENLWFALATAIKSGTFVVAVDTKPPNRVFRDVGIEPPKFVSSRYSQTGVLIGDFIDDWMASRPNRRCVLWTGPTGSWPGEERTRNVIYQLAIDGLLAQTTLQPIASWTPDRERCAATLRIVDSAPGQVAVYCADDENALALHLYTLTQRPELRSRMAIVGCNGTPDDWGNVPVMDMRAVEATVDILAEEQGVQAAMLMVRERKGRLSPSEQTVFIEPKLMHRSADTKRWLDRLFDGESTAATTNAAAMAELAEMSEDLAEVGEELSEMSDELAGLSEPAASENRQRPTTSATGSSSLHEAASSVHGPRVDEPEASTTVRE